MTHTRGRCCVRLVITACLLLAFTACGGDGDNAGNDPPPTIPHDTLPEPVQHAINVAADDAGINPGDVGLIAYTQEEWNDTALGCPQPGGVYAQVMTPGYSVQLLVAGHEVEYHTDMDATVVHCEA